jgi:hypothetical protein
LAATVNAAARGHCGCNPFGVREPRQAVKSGRVAAKIVKSQQSGQARLIFFRQQIKLKAGLPAALLTKLI